MTGIRWSLGRRDQQQDRGTGRLLAPFHALARWFHRLSFRARVGALIAAAVGLTVLAAALASYVAVEHEMLSQVDSSLKSDFAQFQGFGSTPIPADRVAAQLRREDNSIFQILGPQDTMVYPSSLDPGSDFTTLAVTPTASQWSIAESGTGTSIETITVDGQPYRVITRGEMDTATDSPVAIQIFKPLGEIDHTLATLKLILFLVAVGGVGVALALAYAIGRATLRPVGLLTAAAEHVAATQNLDATIEARGDDELSRLARSFNAMLSALASSRQQQAQLISDAGHELRTPLTSLRTNIEVLMKMPNLPETDRAELMSDLGAQLEELTTLIGDVVELGRADEQVSAPIEVRLDAIVGRAVERARRRAPGVVFDVSLTPGSVRAHPALLERAVLNVLDNAAKWSRPGGQVNVLLERGANWTLDIADQGPGIAAADLPHIFDRFYRAESARSMPGSGLGLAIVRKVVTDHGGTVGAASPPPGGTVIHVELPIVVEAEPEPPSEPEPVPEPAAEPAPAPADIDWVATSPYN